MTKLFTTIVAFFALTATAFAADVTPAPALSETKIQVPANSEVSVRCNRTNSLVAVKWVMQDGRCPITVSLQSLAIAANTLGQGQECFAVGSKRGKLIAVPVKRVGKKLHVFPWKKKEGKTAERKLTEAMC